MASDPEYARKWRAANQERIKAYRVANIDRQRESFRAWASANRDRKNELHRNWSAENRDKIKAKHDAWRASNIEAAKAGQKKYRVANRQSLNALSAKKRAVKRNATPPWLTKDQFDEMREIYESASADQHVDHIEPLTGKTACGLHVPWNLQLLSAEENVKKGNQEPKVGAAFPHALDNVAGNAIVLQEAAEVIGALLDVYPSATLSANTT